MGKVVGTRFPVEVEAQLNGMGKAKQAFIRGAVELALSDPSLRSRVDAHVKIELQNQS
jgi:hypothetical protein